MKMSNNLYKYEVLIQGVGFFSRAFLGFLMKESKNRRRKQPAKLMAKSRSQPVNLPCARPLMNALLIKQYLHSILDIPVSAFYQIT